MKSVVSLTGRLDMAIVVDWDVEPQIKHTKSYNIVIESIKIRSYNKKLYQGGIGIVKSTYRGSKVGFLFSSSVPVVLFGTPGISGCRSQHVPVESSSLLHHSIYL